MKERGRPHRAALVKWIRENPEVTLPRGIKDIARLTGISMDQAKTYLYRRRRKARQMMTTLAKWLPMTPVDLEDLLGRRVSPYNTKHLAFQYDHWGLKPTLQFIDQEFGAVIVEIPNLEEFYERVISEFYESYGPISLLDKGSHKKG